MTALSHLLEASYVVPDPSCLCLSSVSQVLGPLAMQSLLELLLDITFTQLQHIIICLSERLQDIFLWY